MARTLILKWNPAISSYTKERFDEDLADHMFYDFNWSVWEHQQVQPGDRFFLIRVGEGNTGLVMAGTVDSCPYKDEDWSGKGRETYYVDLDVLDAYDTEHTDHITTAQLQRAIPDFQWDGGHSGIYLTDEQSEALELLYQRFRLAQVNRRADTFDDEAPYAIEEDYLLIGIDSRFAPPSLTELILRTKGHWCECCGYDYRKVFGPTIQHNHEVLLLGSYRSGRLTLDDYHVICHNCRHVIDVSKPFEAIK